jgi:hypothetical protein
MLSITNILRWILRISFLVALIIGFALWSGNGYGYLRLHMILGFTITTVLLLLVVFGLVARVKPTLPLITLLWTVALPFLGIAQLRIVPGANHWIVRVLHLVIGLGAIGFGESLSKKILLSSGLNRTSRN